MPATQAANDPVTVAAFYKFAALDDYRSMRRPLQQSCADLGLLGTILLATEGINGTVAGPAVAIDRLIERLCEDLRLADLQVKRSIAPEPPFYRMKVRLKKEIVSLGVPGVDPLKAVGEYVPAEEWNALISRPDVRLVDTRNDYEYHLGSFEGAEDPGTRSFREFPRWVDEHLDPGRDEHVAMFCTGGIRCEKATAYLKERGFKNVYHLEGGILKYLDEVPEADSKWRGECFVFDGRVSLGHGLSPGSHAMCEACNHPYPRHETNCPRCGSDRRYGES